MNLLNNLTLRFQQRSFYGGYDFALFDLSGAKEYVSKPSVEMVELKSDESIEPLFTLRDDKCQNLMDEMWSAGFRPKDRINPDGELGAVKYHLQDMRKLYFNKLGITDDN